MACVNAARAANRESWGHLCDEPGQPSCPGFATPSQRAYNPPGTKNETPEGLEPGAQRKTLRPATGAQLSLVALCLEPALQPQGRRRLPRAYRLPTPARRRGSGFQSYPMPSPFWPLLRPGHSAKSKTETGHPLLQSPKMTCPPLLTTNPQIVRF